MTNTAAPALDSYVAVTSEIARLARHMVWLAGTPEDAMDGIARAFAERATDARTRNGEWARETASEPIEEALFCGAVARDVLDGTVSRPSVGNVRRHTLSLI